tara:strand:+ start:1072 stop:1221 length:150 start_codon:yes stop_codon:yes gene_type:complete
MTTARLTVYFLGFASNLTTDLYVPLGITDAIDDFETCIDILLPISSVIK